MAGQTYQRPGTYISETLAKPPASRDIDLSLAGFVGVIQRGPVATPTYVSSLPEFQRIFGGFDQYHTPSMLEYAVWQYFNSGGRNALVVRAADGNEASASVTLVNRETTPQAELVVTAANPGVWASRTNSSGASVGLLVGISDAVVPGSSGPSLRFNLSVYLGGTSQANIVERFVDLSRDPQDDRYVLAVVNSPSVGSKYVTVSLPTGVTYTTTSIVSPDRLPANTGTGGTTVPVPLVGGVDATGDPTLAKFTEAWSSFDAVTNPLDVNLAGVTDTTTVNAFVAYCANRGDLFPVIDTQGGSAIAAADVVTRVGTFVGPDGARTSYGACYFPRALFADPASRVAGSTIALPVSGAVLGLYKRTDATDGIQRTAAGPTAVIPNAFDLERSLSSADLDLLNANGINALRSIPGRGVTVFGGRTIKGTGAADKYVSVRRTLIYVKAQVKAIMDTYLFEPNTPATWARAQIATTQFLQTFWSTGGLFGSRPEDAYYVICDDTNNTSATVTAGELHLDLGVAPQKPAEFIVVNVAQFDGALTITDNLASV